MHDTSKPVGDIVVPVGTLKAPLTTKEFSFDLNLDAAASAGPPPDTFSASIEVFDSLGDSHIITVDYTKSATANEWDYSILIPDADVTTPITPVTGTLTFDANGVLTSPDASATMPQISITGLANGAADMDLNWNLWDEQTPRVTQYAQPSAISANEQDGSPAAQLIRVGLGDGGSVLAQFSNGEQKIDRKSVV